MRISLISSRNYGRCVIILGEKPARFSRDAMDPRNSYGPTSRMMASVVVTGSDC